MPAVNIVKARRPLAVVGLVFMAIGAVGLIAAGILALLEYDGPRTARADGNIINAALYRPTVKFRTASGDVIHFNSAIHSSFWSDGDAVAVAYDPARPTNAEIDGFAGRWFLPGLLGCIFGFFTGVGAVLALVGRRLHV